MNSTINMIDMYNTLVELGERADFYDKDTNEIVATQYLSITPNKSNKAIGTTEGTYLYIGTMTFQSLAQQKDLRGTLFNREADNSERFELLSVSPCPFTEKIGTIQCMMCNDFVDIISHYDTTGYNQWNEPIVSPIYTGKNIPIYTTMVNKPAQNVTVGALDKSITFMTISAKYPISQKSIIMKRAFIFNEETKQNEYIKIPYKIESIDTSMVDELNGELTGVIKCYLSESQDKQEGLNINA